jgi:hypothetical protein
VAIVLLYMMMKSASLRWALGILGVFALLVAGVGLWAWMKIAQLKEVLVNDLGSAIGAHVEVASLDLDVWTGQIRAAGITLVNQRPEAPWEKGSISQATIRFHLGDIFASKMPLSVDISSWTLVVRPSTTTATAEAPGSTPSGATGATGPTSEPTTSRVQVTDLTAREGEVTVNLSGDRRIVAQEVAFQAGDNGGGVWTTQVQAASVTSGSLTAATSSVVIRGEQDKVTFSDLRMECAQGFITGDGEIALDGGHEAKATLKATGVPVSMLVGLPWQVKISGLVDGNLDYTGNDTSGTATGSIDITGGKFNVLPFLEKVTTLVGLPDITGVEMDKATSDYSWTDGTLHLTNIDVRKNDVTRIGGEVVVDPSGRLDGHLKLGLPSTVTARWPDLQTKIFPDQHDDFNWADVHLTGTSDNLQQDLTGRLVAFGLQQGGDLLNQAAQKATDVIKGFLGN